MANYQLASRLASFYRKFVKDFSTIAAPLTKVVKKIIEFDWGDRQECAFKLLKKNYDAKRTPNCVV